MDHQPAQRSKDIRSIFTRDSQLGFKIIFFLLLSIVLMVMDRQMESFATIRAAISLPLAPIHYLVVWPSKMIDEIKTLWVSHDNLVKENLKLKTEQLLLQSRLQRLIAIESENTYLKALMQSTNQVKGKTLIAELLSVSTEPFVKQVVLNKGSKHGIFVGQPVVDANGLMGQVFQIGPITSRVLLVNDPRSGVAVQNTRNGLRSSAVGDTYSGRMKLLYVPNTADIREGDIFITSGLGDRYPEGYPVAKVISVRKDPAHQFADVLLQPSAHLDSSRQVLLIWNQRNA